MEFYIINTNKKYNIKNGIFALNKESGFTSFDYIYKLKKILNVNKIGHTGTLDKEATGVLVCLIDEATSFQEPLMKIGKKVYEAELVLGISTDTEDIYGKVLDIEDINKINSIPEDKIKKTIKSFIGEYKQTPPMVSAKKINGKKLMQYKKENAEVERKESVLQIYDIEIINNENNETIYKKTILNTEINVIKIKVTCSKGTYIRTLCKDIGDKLGIPSCMGRLNRTYTSGYDIKDSYTLEQVKNKIENNDYSFIRPVYSVNKPQVVTFGKFELLHLGHKKIIDEVVRLAKNNSIESTCILIKSLNEDNDNKIMTYEQRISRLDLWGIDNIFNMYLDFVSKNLSPEDFIDKILINDLNAKYIVVGEDCHFGRDGRGDKELLKNRIETIHKDKGIEVHIIEKMKAKDLGYDDENYISSTYIKELIGMGNDEKAFKLLGRTIKNPIN